MLRTDEIKKLSFFCSELPKGIKRKIYRLASSSGQGHITASNGIRLYQIEKGILSSEKPYTPALHSDRTEISPTKARLNFGLKITHQLPVISPLVRTALKFSSYPILPDPEKLEKEIQRLESGQLNIDGTRKKRPYRDLFLDVIEAGYEYAALWNELQRNDQTKELEKLINFQAQSDAENYATVCKYFIGELETAAKKGKPYTDFINTQAMALPALCDAIAYYNNHLAEKYQAPQIKIHQYITDLAPGSIHFFKTLSRLTNEQAQQMYVYGVYLTVEVLEKYHLTEKEFAGVFEIDPKDNPMARPGFRDPALEKISLEVAHKLKIQVNNSEDLVYGIKSGEYIASIMLGSQASMDTIAYAKDLYVSGIFDKIFIFGGNTPHLREELSKLIIENNSSKLILLDNQDDKHAAEILCNSKVIVKRGGGLSIMEEMAMPHPNGQVILIHCKEENSKLTSGIAWEDANVDEFIKYMEKFKINVARTSTTVFRKQLLKFANYYHLTTNFPPIETAEVSNQPIWYSHLSDRSIKDNQALAQVNGTFFAIEEKDTHDFTDIKRSNLTIDHVTIDSTTPDTEIKKLIDSLSDDAGVQYFLANKFNQNTFTFSGHDSLQDQVLEPNQKIYKLVTQASFLYKDKNNKVFCRIITYGFELNGLDDKSMDITEIIPSDRVNPSMIIDTSFIISPAKSNGKNGARLDVLDNTKLIYHPRLDFYLPNLKPAIWRNLYNLLRNNPIKTSLSGLTGGTAVLGLIFFIQAAVPESSLGENATTLITFNTAEGIIGMLGSMVAGTFGGMLSFTSLRTLIDHFKHKKTIADYQNLIDEAKKPSQSSYVIMLPILCDNKEEKYVEIQLLEKSEKNEDKVDLNILDFDGVTSLQQDEHQNAPNDTLLDNKKNSAGMSP